MQLICDDIQLRYYWVDDDLGMHLSPSFDYEADAIQWKYNIEHEIYKQLENKMRSNNENI
jgi:hypothetical protein